MLRFVLAPDGAVVPDVARKLPGRGVWIDARRESVDAARAKRVFSRGFKAQARAAETLGEDVDRLLASRALERLSLAQKAGAVVCGFEKVRARLHGGDALGVVVASDAAADGRSKVEALAKNACDRHNNRTLVDVFSSAELGRALGRDRVVHVALAPGRPSEIFFTDALRLRAYRGGPQQLAPGEHPHEQTFAGPLAV